MVNWSMVIWLRQQQKKNTPPCWLWKNPLLAHSVCLIYILTRPPQHDPRWFVDQRVRRTYSNPPLFFPSPPPAPPYLNAIFVCFVLLDGRVSRTSVLAAANPIYGRYDDLKSAAENIDLMTTILSRFDLIFIVRDIRWAVSRASTTRNRIFIYQVWN